MSPEIAEQVNRILDWLRYEIESLKSSAKRMEDLMERHAQLMHDMVPEQEKVANITAYTKSAETDTVDSQPPSARRLDLEQRPDFV